jgi:hypothetical protein
MAIEAPIYPLLAGNLKAAVLDENDAPEGFFDLGNFMVKVKQNSDLKELPSVMTENYGQAVAAVYVSKPGEITLEGEGINSDVLALLFGGEVTSSTVTGATVTAEAHTIVSPDKSIEMAYRDISTIAIAKSTNADTAYTTVVADNTIEDVAHGLLNGDVVFLTSLANTTGVSINTPYYVVNKTNDDFQLSLTLGGAAIDLTGTDGSGNYRKALNPNSYVVDNARLGLIAPLSTGSTPVAANDILHVYYTYATKSFKTITSGSKSNVNIALLGDLEDQNTGELWVFDCPKTTVTSNSEIQFIGTDFLKVSLTGRPISVNNGSPFTLYKDVA